ncbi:hypothetical protein FRACYDRAFT_249379 [Fragilariopsis cylindrus CCMP1102]|uniref:L domain-like protein n=1 Tax=Fragilariopsis cylindrus CCMP1102 TaxID=635003 RepID=A0A1E7ETC0_9STRA|nr:hypothetical protein FRACYDRAFT_249379 [Fragilariopsis cylindrus CCMP1102]|eukprot:OEU09034.1 hypothetical protein FRACYDRAFT_249379 [Fragilariopsis cylindrus CCMP1102]
MEFPREEQHHHDVPSLTLAERRELRKQAQREAKKLKKVQREKQRIDNKRRLDHRPEVRMAALLEMAAVCASSDNKSTTQPNVNIITHDNGTPLVVSGGGEGIIEDNIVAADRVVSLVDRSLSLFSLPLLLVSYPPCSVLELDVSHNCLSELPGLDALKNLVSLNIRRNEFRILPSSLVQLLKLSRLNASRNQLRPSADLLVLLTQPPLPSLELLDLTFNKKLFTQSMLDLLTTALPTVAIEMTITSPPPSGAYVGESPGQRNPDLLRSQLEPYTTLQLRQRLIETFGYRPYNNYAGVPPESRATVMASLLQEYDKKKRGSKRKLLRSFGVPVPPTVMKGVLQELEAWSKRFDCQERPMIAASKYMILRSPTEVEEKITRLGSRRAQAAQKKFQQNFSLWQVAKQAMAFVDPDFAEAFTGLAVTQNFRGSPHIDTTNIGPFYGLSTGTFEDGTGGIRVELDPMTICEVNTKNRLGRVDGRYPHWVGPYDSDKTRYSLIFYLTEGVVQPKTTAVFGDIFDDK